MFDFNMINIEFKRLGLEVSWPEVICTIEATEWLHGYRLSLTSLYQELFDEKFSNAHEAKADVHALGRCYIEMIKRGWV